MRTPNYTFHPATVEDAEEMALTMRQEDRAEVWASNGHTPAEAARTAVELSCEAYTARVDGKIICMFGVHKISFLGDAASPWLLGTDEIPHHVRHFLKWGRIVVQDWKQKYPVLVNFTDSRYTVATRWLEWLGFTIHPAEPYGPFGVPFHRITIGDKNV